LDAGGSLAGQVARAAEAFDEAAAEFGVSEDVREEVDGRVAEEDIAHGTSARKEDVRDICLWWF
jgi:hypothetical protein